MLYINATVYMTNNINTSSQVEHKSSTNLTDCCSFSSLLATHSFRCLFWASRVLSTFSSCWSSFWDDSWRCAFMSSLALRLGRLKKKNTPKKTMNVATSVKNSWFKTQQQKYLKWMNRLLKIKQSTIMV